ncbi:MAG: hypothetical protein ACRC5M_06215 [Anaeroplasmataceae bacterium]
MTSYEFFCSLEDFSLEDVVNCFIEEFKQYRLSAKIIVLRDEPIRLRGTKEHRAFYCALCEFYCNWYHLEIPQWVNKDDYVLKETYHPFGTLYDFNKSPVEFRKRNISIGPNDIVQV